MATRQRLRDGADSFSFGTLTTRKEMAAVWAFLALPSKTLCNSRCCVKKGNDVWMQTKPAGQKLTDSSVYAEVLVRVRGCDGDGWKVEEETKHS